MQKGIIAITEAYETLEHVAVHGWRKRVDEDGETQWQKRKGTELGHDPRMVATLNLIDKRLRNLADEIQRILVTRENEVLGCTPGESCYSFPTCSHLVIRTKHIWCRIERMERVKG